MKIFNGVNVYNNSEEMNGEGQLNFGHNFRILK